MKKPSLDLWLAEAKAHPNADKVGMYLTHNGVVRSTARAEARYGQTAAPVKAVRRRRAPVKKAADAVETADAVDTPEETPAAAAPEMPAASDAEPVAKAAPKRTRRRPAKAAEKTPETPAAAAEIPAAEAAAEAAADDTVAAAGSAAGQIPPGPEDSVPVRLHRQPPAGSLRGEPRPQVSFRR